MSIFQKWTSLFFILILTTSLLAGADVRSSNKNDPYRIHFSAAGIGQYNMALCGPKGCAKIGSFTVTASENDLTTLHEREKIFYYTKTIGEPLLLYAGPIGMGIKGFLEVRLLMGLSERFAPQLMKALIAKCGRATVLRGLGGINAAVDFGKYFYIARRLGHEWLDADINTASLEVLTAPVLQGQDIVVNESIEDLALHLEHDLEYVQASEEESTSSEEFLIPMMP